MAKKKKISSQNKKSIQITLILLTLCILGAGVFLFLQRDKDQIEVKSKVKSAVSKIQTKQIKNAPGTSRSTSQKDKTVRTIPAVTSKPKVISKPKDIPLGSGAKIAFILDDWGYNMSNCHFLKSIKAPLAIAVMPEIRRTDDVIKCASVNNKDIMLHLPLEPYKLTDKYPDSYLIKTDMPYSKVSSMLDETFKKMPLITGVNNHMGSKATEDKALMKVILKKVRKKGLFFVDSMTAPNHSVVGELADEMGIPFATRDVFLDNVNTREAIELQLVELAQKAKRNGSAIAIGHDRQLTLQVLQDQIPILQKQGFEIVSIKDLLRNKKK